MSAVKFPVYVNRLPLFYLCQPNVKPLTCDVTSGPGPKWPFDNEHLEQRVQPCCLCNQAHMTISHPHLCKHTLATARWKWSPLASDVTAEECVMASCENVQYVWVTECLCVLVKEEEGLWKDKVRERETNEQNNGTAGGPTVTCLSERSLTVSAWLDGAPTNHTVDMRMEKTLSHWLTVEPDTHRKSLKLDHCPDGLHESVDAKRKPDRDATEHTENLMLLTVKTLIVKLKIVANQTNTVDFVSLWGLKMEAGVVCLPLYRWCWFLWGVHGNQSLLVAGRVLLREPLRVVSKVGAAYVTPTVMSANRLLVSAWLTASQQVPRSIILMKHLEQVRVQHHAQGEFSMQTVEARNWTTNIPINVWTIAATSHPVPIFHCINSTDWKLVLDFQINFSFTSYRYIWITILWKWELIKNLNQHSFPSEAF